MKNVKRKANRARKQKVKRRAHRRTPSAHRTRRPQQPVTIRTTTDPDAPRTVLNDIDWDAVHAQVAGQVKAILRGRPRPVLPRCWNERKVVSAVDLKVAGVLITRPVDSRVPIKDEIQAQAARLFAQFPSMVQAQERDAVALAEVLRAQRNRQKERAHRPAKIPARKSRPRRKGQGC